MSFFRKQIRVGCQYLHDLYQLLLKRYVKIYTLFYTYIRMYVCVCVHLCTCLHQKFSSPEAGVTSSDDSVVTKAFSRNFGPGALIFCFEFLFVKIICIAIKDIEKCL